MAIIITNTNTKHVRESTPDAAFTGLASVAMACREWNVDPMRSQSLVPMEGVRDQKAQWWMRPPDLFTMKRCRNPIGILYYTNGWTDGWMDRDRMYFFMDACGCATLY